MKKLFRSLSTFAAFLALTIGVGYSLFHGSDMVEAKADYGDIVTHSFSSSIPSGWDLSQAQYGFDGSKGAQFTNASFTNKNLDISYFSNLYFDQISVTASTNGTASNTKIAVKIGGENFDVIKTLTSQNQTTYVFEDVAKQGDIVITIATTNTNKSTYIKEIITREGAGEPTLTLSQDNITIRPNSVAMVTATPTLFTPTSYVWTENDPLDLIVLEGTNTDTLSISSNS
ncbi:MAG: hypothetical protein RBQ97_09915, partial [Acholeplasma sp.]|nr:hypothetical protein [Acholeplasma sp.]